MSEINEFKSDRQAAEQAKQKLVNTTLNLLVSAERGFVTSNLTVVNNLFNVFSELCSCNADFMRLVEKDADSIEGLQEAFETYDADLSTNMEGQ